MSDKYSHRMCTATPLPPDTAALIARALDPDRAGHMNFAGQSAGQNPPPATHAVCDCLVTAAFADQWIAVVAMPAPDAAAALHAYCAADYAARWPALTPPTLAQCAAFLAGSHVAIEPVGRPLADVLAGWGLTLLVPPQAD